MYNLPNILTISRIVVIPVIFLSVYIHCAWWSLLAAVLFVVAAITDYFDGYFARVRNETSVFGRLLDPIADKLLVISALLIIVANGMVHPISYIPVMVILCREVLVSGLREFLANVKVSMPVTRLAKWKTGFQMTSLAMILFKYVPGLIFFGYLGEGLLWIAGILTFITGYEYFQKSLDYVKSVNKKAKSNKKAEIAKAVSETDAAKKSVKASAKKAKAAAKKEVVKKDKAPKKKAAPSKKAKSAKAVKKTAK
ncbi:MAG: CDP-diacylglycerol--glycerol-3-phosphate 3-phosphatidyltransferase [Lactobacillaceae bacterium]|nr:CDP-diacylglycerol--glycerol-3-phosphate 3-phosphatidyltransferase [Lactobacillaceae bacterium]